MSDKRMGLREIRNLRDGEVMWDPALPGFGARRQKGCTVSYILKYRTALGVQRWYTIGRHGSPWTPDSARDEARKILGRVVDGSDPAAEKQAKRKAESVSELCDLYIADCDAGRLLTRRRAAKKASTLATDKGRIERHIKPLLGRLKVPVVTREHIESFMHSVAQGKTAARVKTKKRGLARVSGGKGTASRTVGLLGAIFTYAVRHRMRSDNPVHGVMRFADGKRERRLNDAEYGLIGKALLKAKESDMWPTAIDVAWFLALTGWRSGEALGLKWAEIDLARRTATLGDTKTGRSVRPLSNAACDLLRSLTKSGDLVFPATRGNGPMTGFPRFWARIAELERLPKDVTPHVLRHSFASLAADLGYSEPTIAALVGHKGRSITSRYIHAADSVLLAAADAVAAETANRMGDAPKTEPVKVVPLHATIDAA